jgi:hypothetical protein
MRCIWVKSALRGPHQKEPHAWSYGFSRPPSLQNGWLGLVFMFSAEACQRSNNTNSLKYVTPSITSSAPVITRFPAADAIEVQIPALIRAVPAAASTTASAAEVVLLSEDDETVLPVEVAVDLR